MKMRGFGSTLVALCLVAPAVALAQGRSVPVPRPFPGADSPPTSSNPRPVPPPQPPAGAAPAPVAEAPVIATGPDLPGVPPVYPNAEYLDNIDAGLGQRYYLYGTVVPFVEIVAYYRTVMRNGGREIYKTPGLHQFELGRFDDDRMAYPPSVVVKDYAETPAGGYLHVAGTTETRFRTIIQVVPPAPE